jgi:hypothetical protein
MDTLVTHTLKTWTKCSELRDSRTKAEANRAATNLARNSQLRGGHYLAPSGLLSLRTGRRLAECTLLGGLCKECNE